jgi:hypothetical protein
MKTLNERFEAETGCASWINSDIYPDGKIHTRQYVEWLEAESQKSAIPCVMPSLEDARIAKEKFQEKKNLSGWDTGYKGLGDHFQEGANWALNWISKRNKSN